MIKKLICALLIICTAHHTFADTKLLLVRDDEAESMLKEVAFPIFKAAKLDPHSISFYIVNDPEPNAMVAGGQNIFITTGLLAFSDNVDMIIGVLAHEVGHIIGGHFVQHKLEGKNMQAKMLLGLLGGAALGLLAGSPEVALGAIGGTLDNSMLSMVAFTRSQESAADSTSIRLMKTLGVGNAGIVSFLQSLGSNERAFYQDIPEYMRTHPVSKSRIEYIKANSPTTTQNSYISNSLRERYRMMHAKIFAFTTRPAEVIKQFAGDTSEAAQYALAIAYFREQNAAQSLASLDKLIAASPSSPYLQELKGQVLYELGNVAASLEFYRKAHELKPSSTLLTLEYSNALLGAGKDVNRVVTMLERVTSHDRTEVYAWELLGKAYKATKNDAGMHLALAYSAYLREDYVTARKHLNMIQGQSPNPTLLHDLKAMLSDVKNPS